MIIQDTARRFMIEVSKLEDIHEAAIKDNRLNITPLERRLLVINTGKHRRIKNNHDERLARFKNQ